MDSISTNNINEMAMNNRIIQLSMADVAGVGCCIEVNTFDNLNHSITITTLFSTGCSVCYMSTALYNKLSSESLRKGEDTHESGVYYVGTIENYHIGLLKDFMINGQKIADVPVIVFNFAANYPVEFIMGLQLINLFDGFSTDPVGAI